jgi:hypothetical protein
VPSPNQFTYFQGGGFDVALLSFMQIDAEGNVNVSKLGARPYLTAGCGGFVDITTHARRILFCGFFTAGADIDVGDGKLTIRQEGSYGQRNTSNRSLMYLYPSLSFNIDKWGSHDFKVGVEFLAGNDNYSGGYPGGSNKKLAQSTPQHLRHRLKPADPAGSPPPE